MKKKPLNFIVVIILTSIAAGLVFAANNTEPFQNNKFYDFPLEIGDWKGREIAMSDYVYQGIETQYLFLRNYYSPRYNTPVNLSIVWFDDTNIAFHAPEACLGGVGNTVKEKTTTNMNINGQNLEIGKLIVGLNNQQQQMVLYYFDVDGYITTSQTDIRLHVLKKRLLLKRASASFIRIMAPITNDQDVDMDMMKDFLLDLNPIIPEYTYTDNIINLK